MSLYTDLRDAGVPLDSHASDLYAKVTAVSRAIVQASTRRATITVFQSAIDGAFWYDIPFAYDPFWERSHHEN